MHGFRRIYKERVDRLAWRLHESGAIRLIRLEYLHMDDDVIVRQISNQSYTDKERAEKLTYPARGTKSRMYWYHYDQYSRALGNANEERKEKSARKLPPVVFDQPAKHLSMLD